MLVFIELSRAKPAWSSGSDVRRLAVGYAQRAYLDKAHMALLSYLQFCLSLSYYLSVNPPTYAAADPLGSWSSWANHKPSLVSPFFLAFKCFKTDGRTSESKEQHTHVITLFVLHHIMITCYSFSIEEERRYSTAKWATISLRT